MRAVLRARELRGGSCVRREVRLPFGRVEAQHLRDQLSRLLAERDSHERASLPQRGQRGLTDRRIREVTAHLLGVVIREQSNDRDWSRRFDTEAFVEDGEQCAIRLRIRRDRDKEPSPPRRRNIAALPQPQMTTKNRADQTSRGVASVVHRGRGRAWVQEIVKA